MVDVRRDVLRPPHGTTPAAVKSNIKSEMRSFKSNENIHKKEGRSYYVVSANKASSVIKPNQSTFFNFSYLATIYPVHFTSSGIHNFFGINCRGKYVNERYSLGARNIFSLNAPPPHAFTEANDIWKYQIKWNNFHHMGPEYFFSLFLRPYFFLVPLLSHFIFFLHIKNQNIFLFYKNPAPAPTPPPDNQMVTAPL